MTGNLGNVALIATGTYLVINGSITLGTMMMFVLFRTFFVERLNNCVNYLMEMRRVQPHVERIDEIMSDSRDATQDVVHEPFAVEPGHGVGIEVRDLWFRYGAESPWIFRGLNFRIEPGESVAITGPSGCGKTTLLNILLGLLEPDRGEVLVNGRSLRTISSFDYAKAIGVVMQVSNAVKSMILSRILVAHRKETIATADRVLNLDPEGAIVPMRELS